MNKQVKRAARTKPTRKPLREDSFEQESPFRLGSNLERAWFGKNDLHFEKKHRRVHESGYL